MSGKVYLSGPIEKSIDNGQAWRLVVMDEYEGRLSFINPVDEFEEAIEDGMTPEALVENEKEMIRGADVMLIGLVDTIVRANGEEIIVPMYGTPREHEYAVQQDIPVVVWYTDAIDLPRWAQEGVNFMSKSLSRCLDYAESAAVTKQINNVSHRAAGGSD